MCKWDEINITTLLIMALENFALTLLIKSNSSERLSNIK